MILIILSWSFLVVLLAASIDGLQNVQCDIYREYSRDVPVSKLNKAETASGYWHTLGTLRSVFLGLVLMRIVFGYTDSYLKTIESGFIFTTVYWFFFDGIISKMRGLSWNYYGYINGKWDIGDRFWKWLHEKFNLNQSVVKSVLLVISLIIYFVF
jgi:hypothetical protein